MKNFVNERLMFSTMLCLITLWGSAKDPDTTAAKTVVNTVVTSDLVTLTPVGEFARFDLTLTGPGDLFYRETFAGTSVPFIATLDVDGNLLPDGQYVYELRAAPIISSALRQAMSEARNGDDAGAVRALKNSGILPRGFTHSGTFRIVDGAIVLPQERESLPFGVVAELQVPENGENGREDGARPQFEPRPNEDDGNHSPQGGYDFDTERRDVIHNDDLIIQGSACIGLDCKVGESFGFDTIRLKENNLQIVFDDTSVAASYPRNDWRLRANDSNNGGLGLFAIDDMTAGRTPFTVEADARNHSLYVDRGGRLGLRTSTPSTEIHSIDGDSPTLRLEQDGSSGFAPQMWDLSGNETNFFIRDVTNGSSLPFRIKPSSPTSSLSIGPDGVGIGHFEPSELLHVKALGLNEAKVLVEGDLPSVQVERTNTTVNNGHIALELINYGQVNLRYNNNSGNVNRRWNTGVDASNRYFISAAGTGGFEFLMETNGNLTTSGTVNGVSDINMKRDFAPVSPQEVLAKVNQLSMSTWSYKKDLSGARHMGPMAQDFYAAFGLGKDERHIAYTDSAGVALTAIQGLTKVVEDLKAEVAAQKKRIAELETQLTQ